MRPKVIVTGVTSKSKLFAKKSKEYNLEEEKKEVKKIKVNMLSLEEWINDKIKEGFNGDDIIKIFFETVFVEKIERYLEHEFKVVKDFERKINKIKDEIKENLKRFAEIFNNEEINDLSKLIKINYVYDFSVGETKGKTIKISVGQIYRKLKILKGEDWDWSDFLALLYEAVGHEFGHLIGELFGIGKDETFAGSISKLLLKFLGTDSEIMQKYWKKEADNIKNHSKYVEHVLGRLNFKTGGFTSGLCIARRTIYSENTNPKKYINLYSTEKLEEIMHLPEGTLKEFRD